MKLFLHAGYVKTGSTAIQRSLALHKDYIKAHGICLPIKQELLIYQIKGNVAAGNGDDLRKAIDSGSLDSIINLIKQDLDAFEGYKNFLYSCEIFLYVFANRERFQLFNEAISTLGFSDVKILVYVRNPASHALSWHGELIKVGRTSSTITEFMNDYNYPALAAKLVKLVDEISSSNLPVHLEFRNYSHLKYKVIDTTWDWLKIPSPPEISPEKLLSKNPVNRSLTVSESEFCRQLIIGGCNPGFLARSLTALIPNVEPIYSYPTLESVNYMYSKNLEYLQILNKYLPESEQLTLSAAAENIDTSPCSIDQFTFSSEQLIQIVKAIAPQLKEKYPLP
jgi:hypothetical protein